MNTGFAPHGLTRRRGLVLAIVVSVLVHGGLAVMLLPDAAPAAGADTPLPVQGAAVELVQQNTVTGGNDRLVDQEGNTARPPVSAHPLDAPPLPQSDGAAPPPATQTGAQADAAADLPINRSLAALGIALPHGAPPPVMPSPVMPSPVMPSPVMPSPVMPRAAAQDVPMPPPSAVPAPLLPPDAPAGVPGVAGTGQVRGRGVLPASLDDRQHNPMPEFPVAARRRAEQGAVTLRIHVLPDGAAEGVYVVDSSGFPALDAAAEMAVMRWHFHPAQQAGHNVASDMRFRLNFVLNQRRSHIPEPEAEPTP